MPTGYTARITEHTTGADFLWACARAFGACVMQRDDDMNAPPKEQEPSDYHDRRLATERAALAVALTRDEAAWRAACDVWNNSAAGEHAAVTRQKAARLAMMTALKAEIEAWAPPTEEHAGLRKFALEQIASDIEFDCATYPAPIPRAWEQYRDEEIAQLRRDIEYHERERAEEHERTASRNKWIRDLRASLFAERPSAATEE